MSEQLKLNLGCASRPLPGYVNVDQDSLAQIVKRYPNVDIPEDAVVMQWDVFNIPFPDDFVHEIRADSFLEHMSFEQEPLLLKEITRLLKPGGKFVFSVPDFEDAIKKWLDAEDNWKEFYSLAPEDIEKQHWFGQYSYRMDQRWGYLTACIFGAQNSPGQFHKNAYTEGKVRAMMEHLGYKIIKLERYQWKDDRDLMLDVEAILI